MNKNRHVTSSTNKKSARDEYQEQMQFHEEKKTMYMFHVEKTHDATAFMNINQHTTSSTKKDQHATISMDKISLTRRKIIAQVSPTEKSTCSKFQEKNQHATSYMNKNQHAAIYMYQIRFTRRKSLCTTSLTNKNQHMTSSTSKVSISKKVNVNVSQNKINMQQYSRRKY